MLKKLVARLTKPKFETITRDVTYAVLYQEEEALQSFINDLVKDACHAELTRNCLRIRNVVEIPRSRHVDNIQFEFCHMRADQVKVPDCAHPDVFKMAGLQIQGFHICDGVYDADTLNYLNSRIRSVELA